MGEILGLGATHYPSLCAPPERMLGFFHHILSAPNIDPKYKDRANWPSEMLAEMGNDEGRGSIGRYRERMWANFRKQRKMIDDFAPDFIVLIGDDQYENFREDIIPPFCIYGRSTTTSTCNPGRTAPRPGPTAGASPVTGPCASTATATAPSS